MTYEPAIPYDDAVAKASSTVLLDGTKIAGTGGRLILSQDAFDELMHKLNPVSIHYDSDGDMFLSTTGVNIFRRKDT